MKQKKLVLQDGREFIGNGFGYDGEVVAELCFNTSMVGYQEIMSDPSYGGQALVMTYPIIGSYGVNDEDYESQDAAISAFIVDNYIDFPSNFKSNKTFSQELDKQQVVGISNLDTRMLTRIIRNEGSQNVFITDIETPTQEAIKKINAWNFPEDIIEQVACDDAVIETPEKVEYTIVAIDHGMKQNITRNFLKRNCKVIKLPHGATKADVMKYNPDGLFLSNGPGDPEWAVASIQLVKDLKGKLPIFGICLGHQIIGLAYGAKTQKMSFGHRGGNHPVKNHLNQKVEITTQNHSYTLETNSVKNTDLEITHTNIHDNTCEGLQDIDNYIMCVQYHPESSAGPEDSWYLFDNYITLINKFKGEQ